MSDLYEHEQHGYIARPCNSERPGPWCLEHLKNHFCLWEPVACTDMKTAKEEQS